MATELLERVVCCPACHGTLAPAGDDLRCAGCGAAYTTRAGVLELVPGGTDGENAVFYNADDDARYGRVREDMGRQWTDPVDRLLATLPATATVVELGSGGGAFDGCHPGYVATDLSALALRRFSSGARVQADAERLPFRTASVDAFFSITALEHVPHPDRALAEIDRCLRPGGVALLYPAWYVRPWAARAIHVRSYSELGWRDRAVKASIVVRDRRPYRLLRLLPGRLRRESALRGGRPVAFEFRPLDPNLEQYLVSDSDAFGSLDPAAVSAFYVSRGYTDLHRPSARSRLTYGFEPLLVRKPG